MSYEEPVLTEDERLAKTTDRLEGVLYQFSILHERWIEERQLAAKQGADTAKLVEVFTEQVTQLKELEPTMQQALLGTIKQSISSLNQGVDRTLSEAAKTKLEEVTQTTAQRLNQAVSNANNVLQNYQYEIKNTKLKTMAITIGSSIAAGLLAAIITVKYLIPHNILPLTNDIAQTYYDGMRYEIILSKVSDKEKNHLTAIVDEQIKANKNKNNDLQ